MTRPECSKTRPLLVQAVTVAVALAVALLLAACGGGGDDTPVQHSRFRLQLPSGKRISLAVDKQGGDVMKVASGQTSRVLTTCLLDLSA